MQFTACNQTVCITTSPERALMCNSFLDQYTHITLAFHENIKCSKHCVKIKVRIQLWTKWCKNASTVMFGLILSDPIFRRTTIMLVLRHVVENSSVTVFSYEAIECSNSKLHYDDGSKYGIIHNKIFPNNLVFSLLMLMKYCWKVNIKNNSFFIHHKWVCPGKNYSWDIQLQHNMTDNKQVHL